jgi:hypothetical protein
MKHVILVNGRKRSGKDYITSHLIKALPSAVSIALADPLKRIISDTFDIPLPTLDTLKNDPDSYPVTFHTPEGPSHTNFRQILQRFGTEGMRSPETFGKDVWVSTLHRKILASPYQYIFVPDFRFPEEYDYLASRASSDYAMSTPDDPVTILHERYRLYTLRVLSAHDDDHIEHTSEAYVVPNPTFTFDNRTYDNTWQKIDNLVCQIAFLPR